MGYLCVVFTTISIAQHDAQATPHWLRGHDRIFRESHRIIGNQCRRFEHVMRLGLIRLTTIGTSVEDLDAGQSWRARGFL